ncbi:MAG: Kelch repeat-containing protein, partial [Chloroflexota bacterium]
LPADHVYQAATELPSGRILIAGGIGVASAEVYDPGSDSWASAGHLHAARQRAVATVLSSGLVLLSGGLANDESATNFPLPAEVFHPDSGQWTLTNPMHGGRINHQATLLPSGKVLVTGGDDQQNALASAEIFDPRTQAWTPAASMLHARSGHVAALIGGQVFVAGGTDGGAVLNSAELYDPVSNGWSPLPAMPTARGFSSLVTLPDSSLLVLGGEVGMNPVPHVEQYSPGRGWTPWPSMIDARMSPGVALVGGRWVIAAGDTPKHLHGAEYMDLQTRAWQAEPDYAPFHTHATLVATTTGLLVLGGPFNGTERLQFDPPKP